ncbi:MAG: cation diffusion facilitator family transporter [Chthoniobacterales bacterium]
MNNLEERSASGQRLLLAGAFVNLFLSLVKTTTGLLGHSNVLVADGMESMVDVFSSLMIWMALKYGAKPPDQDHPYGHGKIESLASLVGGVILFGIGIIIAFFSITRLIEVTNSHLHHPPEAYTLLLLVTVIVFKAALFQAMVRRARAIGSTAMLADALHHRSDVIISLTAFTGISISLIAGYQNADDWAALAACIIIFYNALIIIHTSLGEIMDAQVPNQLAEKMIAMACEVPGVRSAEKCRVRKSGLAFIADLHIRVDAEATVREGHAISHAVKDHLINANIAVEDVTVHLEPD